MELQAGQLVALEHGHHALHVRERAELLHQALAIAVQHADRADHGLFNAGHIDAVAKSRQPVDNVLPLVLCAAVFHNDDHASLPMSLVMYPELKLLGLRLAAIAAGLSEALQ